MSFVFSDLQHEKLRTFWDKLGSPEYLIDDYINELAHYMEVSSELITNSNKRIELKERSDYLNVAKQCKKLLKELEKIPELDRVNLLSVREKRPEYAERSLPMIDPLSYVEAINELAEFHGYELYKCSKLDRPLHGLKTFIERFPQTKNLSKNQFIDLFLVLYEDEKDIQENVVKAIRKINYDNLGKKK